MDKVVVYPGRFQPMLKHHAEVYRRLVKEYPDAEVYIGTSDKVEPGKSPFNFAEKQKIAQAHGIDPSRVLQVKNPYHMDSYPFDKDNTQVIFAVGEKDAAERFPVNKMKKDGTPGYYQRLGFDDKPLPMSQRGYITVAPNVTDGGDVASASAFRQALQGARSPEEAKQIYVKQFGSYDPNVFKMIYNKVADKTMEQMELNQMRKLAGLSEAPGDADNMRSSYYGMSDQQRQLADMGRALMNSQFKYDDELGNKMADVGSELTKFGTPEGSKSLEEILRKLKMDQDDLLKFMKKAKELVDQGAHEMDRDMDRDMDSDLDDNDDEFDTDADATAAVDDMEVDMDETALDLSDIRGEYGIGEAEVEDDEEDVCPECEGYGCEACELTGRAGDRWAGSLDEEAVEEAEVPPGAQAWPAGEPEGAMGGATSYAGTTSYAGDEVSVSEDDYEGTLSELMSLAGIDPSNVYVKEKEVQEEGTVTPEKGDNVGFGMVDKDGLDPIVNEDDSYIAQRVKDMGGSLEDEKDFIKHLAHVAKELKLGRYVLDNPDFIPDIMSAFRELDESGCPCCGGGTCGCDEYCPNCDCQVSEIAPALAAVGRGAAAVGGAVARGVGAAARGVTKAVGNKIARDKISQIKAEIDDDHANNESAVSEEQDEELLALFDLATDEAIGDGFLSGNKAIGAVLQDMEDDVNETADSTLQKTMEELRKLAGL